MKNEKRTMQHFDLLGFVCRDLVTGFEGIADSLSFDLYGCIQIALKPRLSKDAKPGEYPDGRWFDVGRLKKVGKKPVMTVPDFFQWDEKGPATKPAANTLPARS
ncbi:hypothetical protein LCGC14_2774320 [marine sediment metagenome]|uniref:Uncharacterized protein n=2 Tax=marine sediment metagenome TaxID=412755 RepID=A0A0F8YV52_9ZZZZ